MSSSDTDFTASAANRFLACEMQQKITENTARCDISDKKLLTAAAQLIDICNRRTVTPSSAKNSINTNKIQYSNRVINNSLPKKIGDKYTNAKIPNFIVTKVTERKPNDSEQSTALNNNNNNTMTSTIKQSKDIHLVKAIRRQQEIERNKLQIEYHKQHASNVNKKKILNSGDQNKNNIKIIVKNLESNAENINLNNFRVKRLQVSHPSNENVESFKQPQHVINNNVPVSTNSANTIRNFRFLPSSTSSLLKQTASQHFKIAPVSFGHNSNNIQLNCIERHQAIVPSSSLNRRDIVKPIPVAVNKIYSRSPRTLHSIHGYNENERHSLLDQKRKTFQFGRSSSLTKLNELKSKNESNSDAAKLGRTNSCYMGSKAQNELFHRKMNESDDYSELYSQCTDVITRLQRTEKTMVRKKGRPKKIIYSNKTKELLSSPEFSVLSDIKLIKKKSTSLRRSKRVALISVVESLLQKSNLNRKTKVYGRSSKAKEIYSVPESQLQLLNIEPMSQQEQSSYNFQDSNQIISVYDDDCRNDVDASDDIYIEYLDDVDEIESPAYEPHTSKSLIDDEIAKIESIEIEPTSATKQSSMVLSNLDFESVTNTIDPSIFNEDNNSDEVNVVTKTPRKSYDHISPIRKSNRKRKVPNAFIQFIKKSANNLR